MSAAKAQPLPSWIPGFPQQHGCYMVTIQFSNGARTCGPVNYHGGKLYAWCNEDAVRLHRGWKVVAYFAIPAIWDGGTA